MTLTLDSVDPLYLKPHQKYPGEIVADNAITTLISPESDISSEFIESAMQRGDWACAFWDGQRLASTGWYSNGLVPIDKHFSIRFSNDSTYMYKGFTHPDYRGERLHANGMACALAAGAKAGKFGLISYVEGDNFASLRSCKRLGYRIFGSYWLFGIFGHHFAFKSPACRRFDVDVQVRKQP